MHEHEPTIISTGNYTGIGSTILSIGMALCLIGSMPAGAHGAEKTNVVFILTDNQGAWALGCYRVAAG